MSKVCFRLFWSYDIQKTEKWLSEMSIKGYHLESVDFNLRIFKFSEGTQRKVNYRIAYSKQGVLVTSRLLDDGWQEVAGNKHWSFLVNEKDKTEISFSPSREGVLERNRNIKSIMGGVLGIFLLIQLPTYIILGFVRLPFSSEVEVEVYYSRADVIGDFIFFIILIFSAYTYFKLLKSNKRLREENNIFPDLDFTIPKEMVAKNLEKSQSINKEKLIKKIRLGWIYSPDRAEEWLEKMEIEGFNLIKINKLGNIFYFKEGDKRKVRYFVDFQNRTDEDYYEIQRQAGWKLLYTSRSNFIKWILWSKEHNEDENHDFYSVKEDKIKQARKMALTMFVMFMPLICAYIAIIASFLGLQLNRNAPVLHLMFWITPLVMLFLVIELGSFTMRSILYYFRIRNQ